MEIESYIERVDIRVIGVIDELTPIDAFLYFQTHSHGLKLGEDLLVLQRCGLQVEHEGDTVYDILDGSIVSEWYLVDMLAV